LGRLSCSNGRNKAHVLAALALCAAAARDARADAPVTRAASAHFAAGVAYLEGKDPDRFAQAYREFQAAYAASPSWKILGNLAITAQELERYAEARDAYEKYLDEGKREIDAQEASQIRRDLGLIRREKATVALNAGASSFLIVDTRLTDNGAQIVNQYGPFKDRAVLSIRAGEHRIEMRSDGPAAPAWSVRLLPGTSAVHSFEPNRPSPGPIDVHHPRETPSRDQPGNSHTLSYLLWGGGAVTGVSSAALFLEAHHFQRQADASFDRNCPQGVDDSNPQCTSTTAGDAKAANWRTAALVTGTVAGAAVIGGTIAYWVELSSDASTTDDAASVRLDVRAWVSATSIGISGSF
jgi:hypothetical protein